MSRIKPLSITVSAKSDVKVIAKIGWWMGGAFVALVFVGGIYKVATWAFSPSTNSQSADNQTTSTSQQADSSPLCPNNITPLVIGKDYVYFNKGTQCVGHTTVEEGRTVDFQDSQGNQMVNVGNDDQHPLFFADRVKSYDGQPMEIHYRLATK